MSLKTLSIITGVMVLLTVLLFIFTAGGSTSSNDSDETETDGSNPIVAVAPTIDPEGLPSEGKAKLTGNICRSGVVINDGVMLVAERIPDREKFKQYISGPIDSNSKYGIELEPGTYEVFIESLNGNKVALYSQYVLCGLDPARCLDHSLIQIQVGENEKVDNVDVCDYDWAR